MYTQKILSWYYSCSMQKMETEHEDGEPNKHLKMIHYYYINYKEFVNVVKYRLDMMRKKIQSEGKTVSMSSVLVTATLLCLFPFTHIIYTLYTRLIVGHHMYVRLAILHLLNLTLTGCITQVQTL